MNTVRDISIMVIGFLIVFGGISLLWGRAEDWWADFQSTPKIGRRTGKVITVADEVLEEIKDDNGEDTIYI